MAFSELIFNFFKITWIPKYFFLVQSALLTENFDEYLILVWIFLHVCEAKARDSAFILWENITYKNLLLFQKWWW